MLCIVPRADANLWFHRCTSAGEQNSHEHVIWGDGDVLNTSLRGRLIWQETCPRATRAFVSHGDPSTITSLLCTKVCLLATDESSRLSFQQFTPSEGFQIRCECTPLAPFGLTFRVSLRLISLFSSISSCSLRAAENERLSARTYCINSPGTVLKKDS